MPLGLPKDEVVIYRKWESIIFMWKIQQGIKCILLGQFKRKHTDKCPISTTVLKHQPLNAFLKVMDDAIFISPSL